MKILWLVLLVTLFLIEDIETKKKPKPKKPSKPSKPKCPADSIKTKPFEKFTETTKSRLMEKDAKL